MTRSKLALMMLGSIAAAGLTCTVTGGLYYGWIAAIASYYGGTVQTQVFMVTIGKVLVWVWPFGTAAIFALWYEQSKDKHSKEQPGSPKEESAQPGA